MRCDRLSRREDVQDPTLGRSDNGQRERPVLPQKSITERRYGFAAGCEAALGAAVKCAAYQTGYALGAGFAQKVQSFRSKPEPRAQPDH